MLLQPLLLLQLTLLHQLTLLLLLQNNHHVNNISAKMAALREKVAELERAAAQRKAKLDENSAFLQFNWKADVVESWIGMDTHLLAAVDQPLVKVSGGRGEPSGNLRRASEGQTSVDLPGSAALAQHPLMLVCSAGELKPQTRTPPVDLWMEAL